MNANLVITEVDYQLNCPTRDNPFFSRRLSAVKQPKMVDEFANRRSRSIRQIEHSPSNSSPKPDSRMPQLFGIVSPSLMFHLRNCHLVHAVASEIEAVVGHSDHVADYAAARGNGPRLKSFRFWIESDDCIYQYPDVEIPDRKRA